MLFLLFHSKDDDKKEDLDLKNEKEGSLKKEEEDDADFDDWHGVNRDGWKNTTTTDEEDKDDEEEEDEDDDGGPSGGEMMPIPQGV